MRQDSVGASLAAIAGLSVACLGVGTAQAVIIYQDIPDITLHLPPVGNSVSAGIDFLGDGSNEFLLTVTNGVAGSGTFTQISIAGSTSQIRALAGNGVETGWTLRFGAGEAIGFSDTAQASDLFYRQYPSGSPSRGFWQASPGTAFIGLVINGIAGPNYGWARVTSTFDPVGTPNPDPTITLHDFAFESTPHQFILTGAIPAPGTLAFMAMGGLLATRRRR